MKLTTTTQVSVDGVMQGNGGRHPDLDPGFERGGWARPLFDHEAMTFVDEAYQRADAFLFGRRTYDLFAGYWGVREDLGNPIVGALNTRPKYVASTTLTDPKWAGTTVLPADLATAIRELKAQPGGELQVHGSGALTRWLLENDLVDEITLLVCPVIVGQGARLFPEDGPDLALDLVESRAFPQGITMQVYRPAGRPTYATDRSTRHTDMHPDRTVHDPRAKNLKAIPETVSDRGRGVRSTSERPPKRGVPNHRR
jgi:dihydrofolate reductase